LAIAKYFLAKRYNYWRATRKGSGVDIGEAVNSTIPNSEGNVFPLQQRVKQTNLYTVYITEVL
jgi:hypothetical protein